MDYIVPWMEKAGITPGGGPTEHFNRKSLPICKMVITSSMASVVCDHSDVPGNLGIQAICRLPRQSGNSQIA